MNQTVYNRRSAACRAAVLLLCAAFAALAGTATLAQDADNRYVTTTLRGKLTDPETDRPLQGAILRFTGTEGGVTEATTDDEGRFELSGLLFGLYQVEIVTAEGESIKGVNAFPVRENETVELTLRISDRIASETTLTNAPDRFVSVVEKKRVGWKRFWREFALFWGIAAAGGAAAL